MEKTFNEEIVLKILAIGISNETPDHRVRYLLTKLYNGGFGLDSSNMEFLKRIKKIAEEIK